MPAPNTAAEIGREVADREWRCFHCDELLTTREDAAAHFGSGNYEGEAPICIEAATTEAKTLIITMREMWERLLKVEAELDQAEFERDCWAQAGRKALSDPYATWHHIGRLKEDADGRVLAAEAAINAAPRWLQSFLRRRAERQWHRTRKALGQLALKARAVGEGEES